MLAWALLLALLPARVLGETLLAEGGGFRVFETIHNVPKSPRDDAARNRGPYDRGTTYGQNELFHQVRKADGTHGVMWQEYGNNLVGKPIFLTWFSADGETSENVQLADDAHNPWLVGATSDNEGNIYYMEVQDVTQWISNELMGGWTIGAGDNPEAWMVHYDTRVPKFQNRWSLNTGAMQLNDFTENTAALRYDAVNNVIGVYFSHRMTRSMDGLNHQRGLGFVFDPDAMQVSGAGFYQTGSHSFQNSLIALPTGGFVGLELDDGSPRGLQVVKMEKHSKSLGFVPYAFKTRHGSGPTNPAGASFEIYNEISVDGNTFYKWSNDNQVYTELAQPGIIEVDDGFLIFFAGEPPALDSSKMVNHEQPVQFPRNLGWVKIGKDIAAKQVLSEGPTETGGFYGFRGDWTSQSHRGVNWLTDYQEKWLIMSKPKSIRLAPNRIFLMWEQWLSRPMTEDDCHEIASDVDFCIGVVTAEWYDRSSDWREYIIRTEMMVIDDSLNVVKPLWALEGGLLTPQGDSPLVIDGCAIIYVGRGGSIRRWKICEADCPDGFHIPEGKVTDDPCFEPFPAKPYTCEDGVDAGGGTGYGPVRCDSDCRPALCHEVPHFCSSTAQYCPLTCGSCTTADNEEYSAEDLALKNFLEGCEIGSVTHGVHEHRVAAVDRNITTYRSRSEGACPVKSASSSSSTTAGPTTRTGIALLDEGSIGSTQSSLRFSWSMLVCLLLGATFPLSCQSH